MTNSINGYGRAYPAGSAARASTGADQKVEKDSVAGASPAREAAAARGPVPAATAQAAARPQAGSDAEALTLSDAARRTMAEPGFERAKVESIKKAIQEGRYPLDSRRIAESFVALERMIDN